MFIDLSLSLSYFPICLSIALSLPLPHLSFWLSFPSFLSRSPPLLLPCCVHKTVMSFLILSFCPFSGLCGACSNMQQHATTCSNMQQHAMSAIVQNVSGNASTHIISRLRYRNEARSRTRNRNSNRKRNSGADEAVAEVGRSAYRKGKEVCVWGVRGGVECLQGVCGWGIMCIMLRERERALCQRQHIVSKCRAVVQGMSDCQIPCICAVQSCVYISNE